MLIANSKTFSHIVPSYNNNKQPHFTGGPTFYWGGGAGPRLVTALKYLVVRLLKWLINYSIINSVTTSIPSPTWGGRACRRRWTWSARGTSRAPAFPTAPPLAASGTPAAHSSARNCSHQHKQFLIKTQSWSDDGNSLSEEASWSDEGAQLIALIRRHSQND